MWVSRNLLKMHHPTLQHWRSISALAQEKTDLTHAITEAEKVVGYPTSFLNLRWLLTDELANIALHFRKLIGINHPLLDTARKLFIGSNNMPAWGLIVLLVSKTCGQNGTFSEHDRDFTAGVLHSQRALAEVTEMIRTSNIIHKNVANLDGKTITHLLEINFGNKIALLGGDFLLSRSFHELAVLRHSSLNELMSSCLRDMVDADFMGLYDNQDIPLPYKPINTEADVKIVDQFGIEPYETSSCLGYPVAEWTLRNILNGASLLGKSCQGALMLAQHSEEVQKLGFLIGKNIALAWQAKIELELFLPGSSGVFSLVSAPVMLHLKSYPSTYDRIEKAQTNALDINYEDFREEIQRGPALESSQKLQQYFSCEALNVLDKFPRSDANTALQNIINVLL